MNIDRIKTLGDLKKTDYSPKSIKRELRDNLAAKLKAKETIFEGIIGYDHTVLPDVERAVLANHNILLLGLRGQAKTKIARLLTQLLDEYIPIVASSELNDDPLFPLSRQAKDLIADKGDETPIEWVHRSDRYVEKLATPDVSIADLIGDVDPIKAATLKLPYSDERVIHFGLIPRAHRSIFVINELPDLQARIQVSLFNMLQEGDLQIRGFKLRLPLDIQFVFTANPEDYTNRGSIITPLKDRIESQILTHYPADIEISKKITAQEARKNPSSDKIIVPDLMKHMIELIAEYARESEMVDDKSGVSARLSISAYELITSTAERRLMITGDQNTTVRITDLWGIVPAITGKVELVYEGEQEGPYQVALSFFRDALKECFITYFPTPSNADGEEDPAYEIIKTWFENGNAIDLLNDASNAEYEKALRSVGGLQQLVKEYDITKDNELLFMELALFGLSEYEFLEADLLQRKHRFKDALSDLLGDL